MADSVTAEDGRQSLNAHVEARGLDIFARYGPVIGLNALQRLLADRTCVRYPCELVFDSKPLQPGEFAHAEPGGETPDEGFRLYVHPYFATQPDRIPYLALYHLVRVNYGEFASADDAETFGAAALGLSKEAYYAELCRLADELSDVASA